MNRVLAYLALSTLPLVSCELWETPMADPDCGGSAVDADAELIVTSPWLRQDTRAKNQNAGAFSFSGQLAALGQRYPLFDARALWSLVDVDVATPTAKLPFRLLALINRTDLAEPLAPESPAGEARLVYTLTEGPGDDPTSPALPLTVIFEYSLGSAQSAREWAAAFHALSSFEQGTPARVQASDALVESFILPAESPGAPQLSQLRINDARSGTAELYELSVAASGALQRRGVRNTPRPDLAGSSELTAFARDNAGAIAQGVHRVPNEWLADSARVEPIEWLRTSPRLEHDFARGTCSGCHGAEGPGENGFHLSEAADGTVTLSRFLVDEDLPRRARVMRARLCEK
jgi:hypothetical protein